MTITQTKEHVELRIPGNSATLVWGTYPELMIEGADDGDIYQFEATPEGLLGVGPMYADATELFDDFGDLSPAYKWLQPLLDRADEILIGER